MSQFPTLLPEIPEWARDKIDPKRIDQWTRVRREWALEWDEEMKAKMWPCILAVQRNNMIEVLDALRAEVETTYAAAIQRWKETP